MEGRIVTPDEEGREVLEFWHSYRLQQLQPGRFAQVVDRILSHQSGLVGPRREVSGDVFSRLIEQ